MAATDPTSTYSRPRRHSTVIIRWWKEREDGELEAGDADLRGTVLDLGGRTLGHFAGRQALFDLIANLIAEPPKRVPRPPPAGAAKA